VFIKHYGKPDVRFLTTVSPVPLRRTFRDNDVLLANTYSKSVQRAAVEAFVGLHPDVDYFPSYEFVMLADPKTTWTREDYRHLAQPVVERIMSRVMAKYAEGARLDPQAAAKEVARLHQAKDYAKMADLAKSLDFDELDSRTLYLLAFAYKKICDYESAYELFVKVASRLPVQQTALESAIGLAKIMDMPNEQNALLLKHAEVFPDAAAFRAKYAERAEKSALVKLGNKLGGLFLLLFSVPAVVMGYGMILVVGFFGKFKRVHASASALGYFLNATLFGGLACESIPSHAWRERHQRWARLVIALTDRFQKGYCERANKREQPFVDLAMSKGLHKQTMFE
jgi:hypothetical protein